LARDDYASCGVAKLLDRFNLRRVITTPLSLLAQRIRKPTRVMRGRARHCRIQVAWRHREETTEVTRAERTLKGCWTIGVGVGHAGGYRSRTKRRSARDYGSADLKARAILRPVHDADSGMVTENAWGPRSLRGQVLGFPLDLLTLEQAAGRVLELARSEQVHSVVTLNPELVVRSRQTPELERAVREADLVVPDGVGVVWAARRAGMQVPERVPGVELSMRALAIAGDEFPVFFLGAKPGVAERAAAAATSRFGTRVAGHHDGYFASARDKEIALLVRQSGARIVLVGLGERQEGFVAAQRPNFGPAVALSVGGTLDVLAGEAKRTPTWTHRVGLEWAWRVGLDPARWHRAPRLAQFVWLTLRSSR